MRPHELVLFGESGEHRDSLEKCASMTNKNPENMETAIFHLPPILHILI
jgi:hypothetical protein